MPYGITSFQYFKIVSSYMLAAFAGTEVVHRYFSPDLSIPRIPPKKGELKTELYTRLKKTEKKVITPTAEEKDQNEIKTKS